MRGAREPVFTKVYQISARTDSGRPPSFSSDEKALLLRQPPLVATGCIVAHSEVTGIASEAGIPVLIGSSMSALVIWTKPASRVGGT
jgi:hypothetical protein